MIKREYTYFVAYQLHNGDHKRQCHAFHKCNKRIIDQNSTDELEKLIVGDCAGRGIECKKIIFTSITLLSSKWGWE